MDLSTLTPVQATLIATSITATASAIAVVITHRLTLSRDRRHRLWDRRMDTYAEVLKAAGDLSSVRSHALSKQKLPGDGYDKFESSLQDLLSAKVAMFGSPAVTELNSKALVAFAAWFAAWGRWRSSHVLAQTIPEEVEDARRYWEKVEELSNAADEADKALAAAIKAEAKFKKTERTGLARLAFWRD
ncbi:hypothetical protein [Streptomyces sp. IMTB 1903]|uniref:hypothetical protein n=1 Tax=Streptomyces sp. IMTB 1903 TaxID=1776680 RepID=UPI00075DDD38|nr:hypothetical protein [Streptomyces sp. IMTB 1903]